MTYLEAVQVKSREEAEEALDQLVRQGQMENLELNYAESRKIQLANIGYFFGYLNDSARLKAMEFYPEAEHPIFGRQFDLPPQVAFEAGQAMAKASQDGQDTLQAGRKVVEEYNKRKA